MMRLPSNIGNIQQEHQEWVQRMYPNQHPSVPAAGCVEEAGELFHCLLKAKQAEMWGAEQRHGNIRSKLIDAFGDCGIYAVSLCNAAGWSFSFIFGCATSMAEKIVLEEDSFHIATRLIRAACNVHDEPSPQSLQEYLAFLILLANIQQVVLDAAIRATWQEVSKRCR